MTAGVFNPVARAAIYLAGLDRCAGCGRPADSAQHRRARGMGGTSDVSIGHPANGVPLCGGQLAGVLGCHGWAERNPVLAELLGWRLAPGAPALGTPFYVLAWGGWRAWAEVDGCPSIVYVDEEDLDRPLERGDALVELRRARPIPAAAGQAHPMTSAAERHRQRAEAAHRRAMALRGPRWLCHVPDCGDPGPHPAASVEAAERAAMTHYNRTHYVPVPAWAADWQAAGRPRLDGWLDRWLAEHRDTPTG